MIDKSILDQHAKSVTDIVRFLDSSHLKPEFKTIPQKFEKLASDLLRIVPSSPELTKTIQKLVEAKDQAVRSQIHADENGLEHGTAAVAMQKLVEQNGLEHGSTANTTDK
jgi:hypothetical protein